MFLHGLLFDMNVSHLVCIANLVSHHQQTVKGLPLQFESWLLYLLILYAIAEAEQIRNRYSEETTRLSNMQNQISELETKLKEDFGIPSFLLSTIFLVLFIIENNIFKC